MYKAGLVSRMRLLAIAVISATAAAACAPAAAPAGTATPAPVAATAAPTPTPKPPPDKVTFLTDFAAFGYIAPFYAGVEQGYFKDENIDVTITPGAGSADTATKVGAGTAQFGLADTITSVVAIGRGAPIRLVAMHWQRHVGGIAYIEGRKEIKSFKDIEGLKIGAVAGDAYMVILPELMRQAGAKPEAIQVVNMAAANTTAALLAGQVDATPVGAATFSSRALGVKAQGATLKLFTFADNGLDALGHAIIVNNDLLGRNKDLVQRFVRAYAKAAVWSQQTQNQDTAVDAYMKANAQQNRDGEKANYVATIPYQVDQKAGGDQFVFPAAKLEKTVALANQAYSLTVRPDAVFTNEFALALAEALRKGRLP